jgi:hypothetical protein
LILIYRIFFAFLDLKRSDRLEFLVDSASDVITAREEVITSMGLEFLQTVESHGVHSVANKPLYKGYLQLGKSEWMKVEVRTRNLKFRICSQ